MSHLAQRVRRAALTGVVLGFASIGALSAQTQFEDEDLQSFVTAAIAVQEVVQEWTPKIQNAQNEQEANELRMQAQGEFEQAIQESGGMTVEEYQRIGQAALQDPELNARIQEFYRASVGQ